MVGVRELAMHNHNVVLIQDVVVVIVRKGGENLVVDLISHVHVNSCNSKLIPIISEFEVLT